MKVAKITIEAPVASFRYPHFLIGRQISYDMPPPSTIYGHIASAAGDWIDPARVRFAYQFHFESRGSDLEHQHIITKGGSAFNVFGRKHDAVVNGKVQPHLRDFLYGCQLTLYVEPAELAEAFRSPVYCVILGRSQDLARIVSVEELELVEAKGGYIEKTLLPFAMRKYTGRGVTVLMPRYITPPPEREPYFDQYIVLHDSIFAGKVDTSLPRLLQYDTEPENRWMTDPASPVREGVRRCLIFHTFVKGGEEYA